MGGDSSGSVPLALLIGVTIALLGATILVFFQLEDWSCLGAGGRHGDCSSAVPSEAREGVGPSVNSLLYTGRYSDGGVVSS